jgi:hypothetical protein
MSLRGLKTTHKMKWGTFTAVVATTAASIIADAAVLLDFDTLSPGSWVGTAYQSAGVIFDAPGWDVRNENFGGIVLVPSSPNYIRLTEEVLTTTLRFVDPANPAVAATTTYFEFDNLGLVSSSGFYGGLNAVAKDLDGNIVATASIPHMGPFQDPRTFTTTVQSSEIHSVEFTYVRSPWAQGLVPIDNFRFGDVTPALFTTIRRASGSEIEVCWNSRTNRMYQIQYRSDLITNLWTDLLSPEAAAQIVLSTVFIPEKISDSIGWSNNRKG